MADLLIKEEELTQLDKMIGDGLTYRQAAPIVQFFQLLHQKRQAEAQAALQKDEEQDKPVKQDA